MKKHIILVDDHELVRKGLASILNSIDLYKIVADFSSGNELLKYLEVDDWPDLFIIDNTLSRYSGVEICRKIISQNNKTKIILLLESEVKSHIINGLISGAKGFLLKNSTTAELCDAIVKVLRGEMYFNPCLSQSIYTDHIELLKYSRKSEVLSEREVDIVRSFANGYTYQEISDHLCISKKTIESHRKNIINKLNLTSNVDIVKYAIRKKIIELG